MLIPQAPVLIGIRHIQGDQYFDRFQSALTFIFSQSCLVALFASFIPIDIIRQCMSLQFELIIAKMEAEGCSFVDYFKLFKVFELKKIEKTGLVKIVQDKELNRKILAVEGNISTSNFIAFHSHNFPNIPFSERYLYLQGFVDPGKSFCFQVAYTLATKPFKAVYSTLYKAPKKHLENMVHLPINLPAGRWTIIVVDLYELGLHFGFKAQEMKMIFRVSSIQIRASSKVKGLFQSDYLFSVHKLPKDMQFPLRKQEGFFEKYHYSVQSTDPSCLKYASQVKQVIQQSLEQAKKQKQQKAKEQAQSKKPLSASKSRKSLEKKESTDKNIQPSKQMKAQGNVKKTQNGPPLPPASGRRKEDKIQAKPIPKEEQIEDSQILEQQVAPVPRAMITLKLSCVQGFSLNQGSLMAVEAFLCRPVYMPVHKPIRLLTSCDDHNARVVTGYNDGSICIWDAIRRVPLGYFLTQLAELKAVLVDKKLAVVLVGLDRMKREVINIVSEGSVVFRQISNYNIGGALLISPNNFEGGIVTFGFENIRLWRINTQKGIIQGSNIYLGQSSRKVRYSSAIMLPTREDILLFVGDSNGFITTVSVAEGKMLQSLKIDTCGIDQMLLLKDGRCLYGNENGGVRVIDLGRMEVLEEYSLNNRIRNMRQLPSEDIILTHFNKSVGSLSLNSSMYSFLARSHTAPITGLTFSPYLSKTVSISRDNSIRIWHYVAQQSGPFEQRLQQQYQFVITGQQMVAVACGVEGRMEQLSRVVAGSDTGKLRAINIEKYSIEDEVVIENGAMSLSISRNGKYVLCTYSSGNSYLLDGRLTILYKYLRADSHKKRMKAWKNGFNRINKEYYIENVEEERLQFYALKDQANTMFSIPFRQDSPSLISSVGNRVCILSSGQLALYERQALIQVVNLSSPIPKGITETCSAFEFPLLCQAIGEKLKVRVVTGEAEEEVDLPESLSSIKICYNAEKQEGLLVCAGRHSFALYVFTYQLHNISDSILFEKSIEQPAAISENEELQISFSNKTTVSGYVNKRQESGSFKKTSRLDEGPKELRSLYAKEQALYEEVKEYLIPKALQSMPINRQEEQQYQQSRPQNVERNTGPSELAVMLNYGYQLRQQAKQESCVGSFFWLTHSSSLILLSGCGRRILQHCFSVPVKHYIVDLPSAATHMSLSQQSYEGLRYLAVSVGGLIRLYNVSSQISFVRGIDAISTTFLGAVIFQSAITKCGKYLLTLSCNSANFDGKLYIHLIELSTGYVVSSSYLSLPIPKNKHKGYQVKQAKEYQLLMNNFKNSLEFVVFNPQGEVYFYRITSVLTMQTMQLQEMVALCRDKLAALTCACFISFQDQEDAVLAIGSDNGSLVFVDCRSGSILIACIAIIPTPIMALSFAQHEEGHKLVLFTNSPLLTVFTLAQGLNSLLAALEPTASSGQARKTLTVDGQVSSRSNSEGGQQMVVTKTGSLWLLDYGDWVTVKVSSVHTMAITQAEILTSQQGEYLLTSSLDGTVKFSNLMNLEQTLEVYKPRRQAKCFCSAGGFALLAFNDECYIYGQLTAQGIAADSSLSSLGSFRLESSIISIQNIPSTDNYYILTEAELLIVHVAMRQRGKNKSELSIKTISRLTEHPSQPSQAAVQISKITDVQAPLSLAVNGDHAPYDQLAIVAKTGRATIWSRKCLKRTYNPIDQLINVHELSYYLIDAHAASPGSSGIRFLSQNQYLWALLDEGAVQVRNFRQHCVTREIKLAVQRLSAFTCAGQEQLIFYAGDQNGYLYVLSENGLLVDRTKALECSITGISEWSQGSSHNLLAYGGQYAAALSLPPLRQ